MGQSSGSSLPVAQGLLTQRGHRAQPCGVGTCPAQGPLQLRPSSHPPGLFPELEAPDSP